MIRKKRGWNSEQERIALAMKARGIPYSEIADAVGKSKSGVMSFLIRAGVVVSHRKERPKSQSQKYMVGRDRPSSVTIPPSVLQERERAQSSAVSLTAMLLGDPLPGRSALDRSRAA